MGSVSLVCECEVRMSCAQNHLFLGNLKSGSSATEIQPLKHGSFQGILGKLDVGVPFGAGSNVHRTKKTKFLKALQVREARIAIGSSSMRGRGSKGAVKAGRHFLNRLSLSRFGTSDQQKFTSALNAATDGLKDAFPRGSRYWGLARKGLNIFLRDCFYNVFLRKAYRLDRAEKFLEVPLDSLVGKKLHKREDAPRWKTIRSLKAEDSDKYQDAASKCARSMGIERVHLDVFWWGSRQSDL